MGSPSLSESDPGCVQKLTRYSFITFNVLFTVIGLSLVIAGSYGVAKAKGEDIQKLIHDALAESINDDSAEAARTALISVAALVIVIGIITMCISSCGWLGACRQNACLLFTFSVCMIVIVLIEFILGITVLVVVKKFNDPNSAEHKEWSDAMTKAGKQAYKLNTTESQTLIDAWNLAQESGHCCGVSGSDDWKPDVIPASCFDRDGKVNEPGCYDAYKEELARISSAVGGVAIGFCVIEIFGIVISCYLACSMRKGARYEQH